MHSWKNSIADMIVIDDWFIKELKLLNISTNEIKKTISCIKKTKWKTKNIINRKMNKV